MIFNKTRSMIFAVLICIVFIISLISGCTVQTPKMTEEMLKPIPPKQEINDVAVDAQDPQPEIESEGCTSTLEPQKIRDIKVSLFDDGIEVIDDHFSFRVLPVDSSGEKIIPAEGYITVSIFSSREEFPLQRDFELFKRSFYVKPGEFMDDCGPVPIDIDLAVIRGHKNYRYVNTPNPGVIYVEYKATGSDMVYDYEYQGAEQGVDIII